MFKPPCLEAFVRQQPNRERKRAVPLVCALPRCVSCVDRLPGQWPKQHAQHPAVATTVLPVLHLDWEQLGLLPQAVQLHRRIAWVWRGRVAVDLAAGELWVGDLAILGLDDLELETALVAVEHDAVSLRYERYVRALLQEREEN